MASVQITRHQKSFLYVLTALTTNLAKIIAAFIALFTKTEEEAQKATESLTFLSSLIDRGAREVLGDAVGKDDHLGNERADDAGVASRRDKAVDALRTVVVPMRRTYTGLFGDESFEALGVKGETPNEHVALARFARNLVDGLRKAQLPAPLFPGATFDAQAAAASLEPLVSELEAALEAVRVDNRENHAALVDRDEAFERSRKTFSAVANFTSALLALAGLVALSKRVRPTGRDPGTVNDPDAPVTEPETPNATDGAAA